MPFSAPHNEPFLLTPEPLTTLEAVKRAMLRDWGSWDEDSLSRVKFGRGAGRGPDPAD